MYKLNIQTEKSLLSRTKKTRPLYVRMADPTDNGVDFEEFHDHANGNACDLPETISLQAKEGEPHNCYYHFRYVGVNICGCPMCTDQDGRKALARRSRHNVDKEIEAILLEQE